MMWFKKWFTPKEILEDIPARRVVHKILQHIDYKIEDLKEDGNSEAEIETLHEVESFIYDIDIMERK